MLRDAICSRVQSSRQNLGHLRSEVVSQRLTQLVSDIMLFQHPKESQHSELTEVTQVLRIACSCNICGQQFASFHALRTHIGKSHPEASIALTKADYAIRSERHDAHMQHATNGLPQCNKCGKNLVGGRPLCPILDIMPVLSSTWHWKLAILHLLTPLLAGHSCRGVVKSIQRKRWSQFFSFHPQKRLPARAPYLCLRHT